VSQLLIRAAEYVGGTGVSEESTATLETVLDAIGKFAVALDLGSKG
jgi:hypothetical protein